MFSLSQAWSGSSWLSEQEQVWAHVIWPEAAVLWMLQAVVESHGHVSETSVHLNVSKSINIHETIN